MSYLTQNLAHIQDQIWHASQIRRNQGERTPRLLAVSKKQSLESIYTLARAGVREFGENYVQEGVTKIQYFRENHPELSLIWHHIGHIQSNKTQMIAENFDWVQGLDRIRIAENLHKYRENKPNPLQVLIQINIDKEPQKSGIFPEDLIPFLLKISELKNLKIRGLMLIPKADNSPEQTQDNFEALLTLFKNINISNMKLDTLSMGMSEDYQMAIRAGSDLVRIGTALFGARQ